MRKKPVVLMILDGYGLNDKVEGNAVAMANTPVMDSLMKEYPYVHGNASGMAVGLPEGQMGNSEVGHMNMGAGRIVYQELTRITKEIQDGDFFKNEALLKAIENCKKNNSALHLMGLLSDGGVHSHITHLYGLLELAKQQGLEKVYVHCFLDGRDTPPASGKSYAEQLNEEMKKIGVGKIASVMGRYYAMDRDKNYDRTKVYYDLVTKGRGIEILNIENALKSSYDKGITDEFLRPMMINREGTIKDGDVLIWMNYRSDRSKQILLALTNPKFTEFDVTLMPNLEVFTFFNHDKLIKANVLINEPDINNSLGIYLSKLGMTQARIAESEKYPHVTYFFDEGYEGKLDGVDKFHIPSPDVATYDLKPEMSAVSVTKKVINAIEDDYDFILVNFANPDMVGHTGNMEATTKACMALDICFSKILQVAEDNFYTVIL